MIRPLLLALLLAACHKPAAPSPHRERALACSPPPGQSTTDRRIRELQAKSLAAPDKAEPWIALGNAWVRKARESTDPSLYAQAEASAKVALEAEPGSPAALDLRAMVLLNDHRFAEAR